MMLILSIIDLTLPLTDPVLLFSLLLFIILFAPIILNKVKIPHLIGLIISGAIIGPHGLNLMQRDSSIILFGTVGLLYIMFLAGLEIDLAEFKKNSTKSLIFGLYTFIIPMVLGTMAGLYILHFSLITSVLLASMFASHTLIAYPLLSKLGVTKNRAVNITVGGTMITDTLALLVLAAVVSVSSGEASEGFWIKLGISVIVFGLIVMLVFPLIGRWFFKRFDDNISQYIFVLGMVFLGAFLAESAGIEAIIGAFLAGLALNRLIPRTSPLMNRIDFVGNALFIPFFLIGVGMLINYEAFFKDTETIKVAVVMTLTATIAKFSAAWLTQRTFKFTVDERRLIFGLSNAQAAATLAAVLVGYNIILGQLDTGEPIRLLDETVLNGTILMILVTCTVASLVAQKGGQNIALSESSDSPPAESEKDNNERILIALNNLETTEELINLSLMVKSKANKDGLYALNVVISDAGGSEEKVGKKILEHAVVTAASTDHQLIELLRYDLNVMNGIINIIKEHAITDLILGLHRKKEISDTFYGNLTEGILSKTNANTMIYKPLQPLSTIQRHLVIVPQRAEKEVGFAFWLIKVWNIARNTGTKLVFYSTEQTLKYIKEIHSENPVDAEFIVFNDWNDFLIISRDIKNNDNLIIVLSRKNTPSFHPKMNRIPYYLNQYFETVNFILIFPTQIGASGSDFNSFRDSSAIEALDEISNTISRIFRVK